MICTYHIYIYVYIYINAYHNPLNVCCKYFVFNYLAPRKILPCVFCIFSVCACACVRARGGGDGGGGDGGGGGGGGVCLELVGLNRIHSYIAVRFSVSNTIAAII